MVVEGLAAMAGALQGVEAAASVTAALPAVESAVSMGPALGAKLADAAVSMPAADLVHGLGGMNLDFSAPIGAPGAAPMKEIGGMGGGGGINLPPLEASGSPAIPPSPEVTAHAANLGTSPTTEGSVDIPALEPNSVPDSPAGIGELSAPDTKIEKSTDTVEAQKTDTEATKGESFADVDKSRLDELNNADTGNLSAADLKERNDLRAREKLATETPAEAGKRYDDIRQRLESGETVSDAEAEFADKFETDRATREESEQSGDATQDNEKLEELGKDALEKMANDPENAEDAVKKFQEEMKKQNPDKTPQENFNQLVKDAMSKERKQGGSESRDVQEMRHKLQELIRLERDLMAVEQRLAALRQAYDETKKQINQLEGHAHRFEKDQKTRMERYKLLNHLITLQGEGKKAMLSKYEIKADYASTKAYLDRKLGVHGLIGQIKDYAVAAYHKGNVSVHSEVDWMNTDVGGLALAA